MTHRSQIGGCTVHVLCFVSHCARQLDVFPPQGLNFKFIPLINDQIDLIGLCVGSRLSPGSTIVQIWFRLKRSIKSADRAAAWPVVSSCLNRMIKLDVEPMNRERHNNLAEF